MTATRREFLSTAAALALAPALVQAAPAAPRFAYLGGFTSRPDGTGNGEGIYLFDYQPSTGRLRHRRLAAKTVNPTWLALHPSRNFLYASNEISDYPSPSGSPGGSLSAFAIDSASGALSLLNTVSSTGPVPSHISLDATGRFLFVSNYGGGNLALFPLLDDGRIAPVRQVLAHSGPAGARLATEAPLGSFAISGHDRSRPHQVLVDPGNRFLLAVDLGEDRVYTYPFDPHSGHLSEPAFLALPSGNGPRHLLFHPHRPWLYLLEEEASRIAFCHFDPASGAITLRQSLSTLPPGFAGTSYASELVLSPDARFLYCANRLHDTVALFALAPDGHLVARGEFPTLGDYPRHIALSPDGAFLFVCAQRSDVVTSFRVDRSTGRLHSTGDDTPAGAPAVLLFL